VRFRRWDHIWGVYAGSMRSADNAGGRYLKENNQGVTAQNGARMARQPVVARYRRIVKRLYFRGDAAFANPEMYEFLESEGIGYTIRLPAKSVLQSRIGHLLNRPVGRPPHEVRSKPRRVAAKVEWHPGELYPRVNLIVTNLARPASTSSPSTTSVAQRSSGSKEGKNLINWTRLSCRSFADNAVRLQLRALAYNLGNFVRTLAMPNTAQSCSLTILREKLIKIGAKVVSHGRYITFQMAEVAVPR
jgi:hypothetical protein